jgi:hypothetical protein
MGALDVILKIREVRLAGKAKNSDQLINFQVQAALPSLRAAEGKVA